MSIKLNQPAPHIFEVALTPAQSVNDAVREFLADPSRRRVVMDRYDDYQADLLLLQTGSVRLTGQIGDEPLDLIIKCAPASTWAPKDRAPSS